MKKVRVDTYLGCCGDVSSFYDPEEPGLYRCSKCKKIDYPDAFQKMDLENKILPCSHCKKDTKQELENYDDFTGAVETECSICKNIITHNDY
ncbi:hypothetical protein V1503_24885 [Bacillus sp. SCS-151]|uniref:hypothetical protein n=1 Tax=Nanhaiella sioensis TaxID=3115293 RepID=UPI00397915BF